MLNLAREALAAYCTSLFSFNLILSQMPFQVLHPKIQLRQDFAEEPGDVAENWPSPLGYEVLAKSAANGNKLVLRSRNLVPGFFSLSCPCGGRPTPEGPQNNSVRAACGRCGPPLRRRSALLRGGCSRAKERPGRSLDAFHQRR